MSLSHVKCQNSCGLQLDGQGPELGGQPAEIMVRNGVDGGIPAGAQTGLLHQPGPWSPRGPRHDRTMARCRPYPPVPVSEFAGFRFPRR